MILAIFQCEVSMHILLGLIETNPSRIVADVPLIVLWVCLNRGVIRCFLSPPGIQKDSQKSSFKHCHGGRPFIAQSKMKSQ